MFCYRHPKVETFLRCQKCERPICTDCSRVSVVGSRCPECVVNSSPLFQVGTDRLALGALAGLGSSFVIGWLLFFLSGMGFFLIWGGLIGGGAVGEAVLRAIKRKRGVKVEIMTGVSALIGMILAYVAWYGTKTGALDPSAMMSFLQVRPYALVAAGIAVFSAVSRVRFF
jgi:hypothetical protein